MAITSINRSPLCYFLYIFLNSVFGVPNFHFSCNLIQKTVLSNCFRIHLCAAVQNEISMRQRGIADQIIKRAHPFVCTHSITQQSFYFQ